MSFTPNKKLEHGGLLVPALERLLLRRAELSDFLQSLSDDLPAGSYRRAVQSTNRFLKNGTRAKDLSQSPEAVTVLLPLLAKNKSKNAYIDNFSPALENALMEMPMRQGRTRVLTYPLIVLALTLLVLGFLCSVVVPVFQDIFYDFGLQLPGLTLLILNLSRLLRNYPWTLVALGCVTFVGGYLLLRFIDRIPALRGVARYFSRGTSQSVSAMTLFVQRVQQAIGAGLASPDAIRLAAETSPISQLNADAMQLAEDAQRYGGDLRRSRVAGNFPVALIDVLTRHDQAIRSLSASSPEESDVNDNQATEIIDSTTQSLKDFAIALSERVESRVDWTGGVGAQFAILLVGACVGVVVIGLLSPLVSLVENLS